MRFVLSALLAAIAVTAPAKSDVGIKLKEANGKILVDALEEGGPAAASREIQTGDQLKGVSDGDGAMMPTRGRSVDEVQRMLEGKENSEVRLQLVPADNRVVKLKVIALQRAPSKSAPPATAVAKGAIKNGKEAPELVFTDLANGQEGKLADSKGKIVVLMFWASWFPGSHEAVKEMQGYADKHPKWADQVELLAFSTDRRKSSAEKIVKAKDWSKTRNIWGTTEARKAYNPKSIVPTVYIVDREGKIAASGHPSSMSIPGIVDGLLE